jgi:hypothetical protein
MQQPANSNHQTIPQSSPTNSRASGARFAQSHRRRVRPRSNSSVNRLHTRLSNSAVALIPWDAGTA